MGARGTGGGEVSGRIGARCVCNRMGGGWRVSCGARRAVNVTKKTKSMVRKRKKKRQKEGVTKKSIFFFTMVLGRIDP